MNHCWGECLLKPLFKEAISKGKLNLGHMIDNGAFSGFLFRSTNGMSITRCQVCAVISCDEGKGGGIF
jgi:hypothetical protein